MLIPAIFLLALLLFFSLASLRMAGLDQEADGE
jgi:hypothetical protein